MTPEQVKDDCVNAESTNILTRFSSIANLANTGDLSCKKCNNKRVESEAERFKKFLATAQSEIEKQGENAHKTVNLLRMFDIFCEEVKAQETINQMELIQRNSGVATKVTAVCTHPSCKHSWSINPDLRLSTKRAMARETFSSNIMLTLSLYLNGSSGRAGETMLGLLDLPNSASFRNTFSACEDVLGKVVIEEVNKVLDDNFEKEVEQEFLRNSNDYKTDFETWKKAGLKDREVMTIVVSMDTAWQGRSSGNAYNSLSSHSLYLAGYTQLPVALMILAKYCATCDKAGYKEHDHKCPKNYNKSSKGMECHAVVLLAIHMWDKYRCLIRLLVIDDDSCMMANMKHSIQEKIDAGKMKKEDWPRKEDKHGKMIKVKDTGKLPLRIPVNHPGTGQKCPQKKSTLLTGLKRLLAICTS